MNEGSIIMALSEQEKMRAAAKLHLSREALLAASNVRSGASKNSFFAQNNLMFGRDALLPSIGNQMSIGQSSSLLENVDCLRDRSILTQIPSGMTSGSSLSDVGIIGMGSQAVGLGVNNMLSRQELFSNAGLLSAIDRNRVKVEQMVIMRHYEAMRLAEERARTEAWKIGLKMNTTSTSVVTPGSDLDSETTLAALGNSMRKKSSPYVDASAMADPPSFELSRRRTRGGVTEPFPEKLHRLLLEIEKDGNAHIISFFPHGRAFGIHDTDAFEEKIMPKYFKQSRLSSFQRQLNLYGFTRIVSGPDASGYYHELFLKGRPALCTHMRRVGIPKGADRRKIKSSLNKKEPDFYSMMPSV